MRPIYYTNTVYLMLFFLYKVHCLEQCNIEEFERKFNLEILYGLNRLYIKIIGHTPLHLTRINHDIFYYEKYFN